MRMARSCWSKGSKTEVLYSSVVPAGYVLRARRESDDTRLVQIENRAAELFRAHGYPQVSDHPIPDAAYLRGLIDGKQVWVVADAGDQAVGFAFASSVAGYLHLAELSVDPAHGRKGIGRALVQAIIDAARRQSARGVSLTTFRDVPFNQPYYARLGFFELPVVEAPPALAGLLAEELPEDVDIAKRVLMVHDC